MGITEGLVIIILFGLVAAFVAYILKIPPILGYIISGVVIGPYGANLISDVETVEMLAEMGVILLLFSIGLDFSFRELNRVKKIALYGTSLQILLVIGMGYAIGAILKLTPGQSFVLGAAASLSSTMIVIKLLMSQNLMGTLSSRVMIGILIVQDLLAVPLMIVIPQINNMEDGLPVLAMVAFKGVIFLAVIVFVGTKVLPAILRYAARWDSRELFLVTITALGLGVGYATYLAGLSFAFGAFVAGMVLSESEYSHQALNDIVPLRDIFGLLFFTSIGMLFNPFFAMENISAVALVSLMVLGGKAIILAGISRLFGYFNIIPIATGLSLAQIGEFSFVLIGLALKEKIITADIYSLILSTAIVTMMVSPFLVKLAVPLYELKKRKLNKEENTTAEMESYHVSENEINNHIVIVGAGRVGRLVASVLFQLKHSFVLLESNFQKFEAIKDKGYPVIFGDASNSHILNAAHIEKSKLLLLSIPDIMVSRMIIEYAKKVSPDVHVIARADGFEFIEMLREHDVFELVVPEFEASLEIIRQALLHMNEPVFAIQKYIDDLRHRYAEAPVKPADGSLVMKYFRNASHMLNLEWFSLDKGHAMIGESLKKTGIRKHTGVSVVGVVRQDEFLPNPTANFVFKENDFIAVIGGNREKEKFLVWMAMNKKVE